MIYLCHFNTFYKSLTYVSITSFPIKFFMFLIILNAIFCLAFAAFAYVNLNDIDAWLWVTIYLVASVCCGLAAFGKYYPTGYLVAIAFYLIYAIILFFAKDGVRDWITKYKKESIVQSMQATKPYIEKTREFFGLLIISGALAINYFAF
jgi:transmembrane protein TMEM220